MDQELCFDPLFEAYYRDIYRYCSGAWAGTTPGTRRRTCSPSRGDASTGDLPLTIVEQDPDSVFLSRRFVEGVGREPAVAVNDHWQQGLDFYGGLSSDSRSVVAPGTGLDMLIWDQPDLVIELGPRRRPRIAQALRL